MGSRSCDCAGFMIERSLVAGSGMTVAGEVKVNWVWDVDTGGSLVVG